MMAIERFENVDVNNLQFGTNEVGEYTTTISKWFSTRARVRDVKNNLEIDSRYRVYQDLVNLTFNYTPNFRTIVNDMNLYSLTWRNRDWRITDAVESNDRMSITLLCYRNDPTTRV
jgi:hypothetical protein